MELTSNLAPSLVSCVARNLFVCFSHTKSESYGPAILWVIIRFMTWHLAPSLGTQGGVAATIITAKWFTNPAAPLLSAPQWKLPPQGMSQGASVEHLQP